MAHGTLRTCTLSLLLLTVAPLALPAQAGFVWLAPEGAAPAPATEAAPPLVPAPEGAAVVPPRMEEAPAVASTPSVTLSPSPAMPPESGAVALSPAAPAPAPMAAGAAVTLGEGTVMGTPVYARGDQKSSGVAPPSPLPEQGLAAATPAPDATRGAPVLLSPVTGAPIMSPPPDAETTSGGASASPGSEPVRTVPSESQGVPVVLSPVTGQPVASAPLPSSENPPAAMIASSSPGSVPATPAAAPVVGHEKLVEGFGKQVPLTVALRQILPSTYGFAHRDGVDLSRPVDWQGGRPWPQVLEDALRPLGLQAHLNGDTVLIERAEGRAAALPVAAVPSSLSPLPTMEPRASSNPSSGTPNTPVSIPSSPSLSAKLGEGTLMQSPSLNP